MRRNAATTAVFAAALLAVVLFAPTAGAARGLPVTDTRDARLDGLPALDEAPRSDVHAFAVDGRRSEPVETPITFSLLGFEFPDPDTPVWFRTSADGEAWTDWEGVHVHVEEGPDRDSAVDPHAREVLMSAPVWVREARFVQTRVGGGHGPEDVTVHLIDSLGHDRGVVTRAADAVRSAVSGLFEAAPAAATVDRPAITTRSGWGADESLRSGTPSYASDVDVAFVHHTAGRNDYTASEAPAIVRAIYHYHTRTLGWSDIGYNFLVDRFGTIYEGRAGGMDRAVIGAHAGGFNTASTGVAILGSYDSTPPSAAALEGVAQVLAWKFDVHHVDAGATATMTSRGSTRYASGTSVTLDAISGHRDVSATACPGKALGELLPSLRDRVLELASDMFIKPAASPTRLTVDPDDTVDGGPVALSTRLRPSGAWTLEVHDDDGRLVHTQAGSGSTASVTWHPSTPEPGTHTWRFRADGRRTATGAVDVDPVAFDRVGSVADPVAGAAAVSATAFGGGDARHAVLARDDVFADAMAGGPLAGTDGPLLFTGSGALDSRVRTELERVLPAGRPVYVLGGEVALSAGVAQALADRWEVRRLGGADRLETAALVAGAVRERTGSSTVMLARAGPDHRRPWADALAGGVYGAHAGIPVLLTYPTELAPVTRAALDGVETTIVLGGPEAVSEEVAAQVPGLVRVSGPDRAATAAAVAEQLWGRTAGAGGDRWLLASGYHDDAWTMPLAAAPLGAAEGAPLILALSAGVPEETAAYLERLGYGPNRRASGWVLGDPHVVGEDAVTTVSRLLR